MTGELYVRPSHSIRRDGPPFLACSELKLENTNSIFVENGIALDRVTRLGRFALCRPGLIFRESRYVIPLQRSLDTATFISIE